MYTGSFFIFHPCGLYEYIRKSIPSDVQASYDDIIAHARNKIENNKYDDYYNSNDINYYTKYNKWKNKYYWNRGWKYRPGYWDDGYWNNGYWYYNPYLFYSYFGYPYSYPYPSYYYISYPYLDTPITNINNEELDEIEEEIINEEEREEENNSEEFNKFLLDELIRLKIKSGELESKNKDENETSINEKQIMKFINEKIKEENLNELISTTKNTKIEKFGSIEIDHIYWIVLFIVVIIGLIYYKNKKN